ncbi:MAG: pentapeptide repeat-containing protein [Microvirga sp.]
MSGANLTRAKLTDADLRGATLIEVVFCMTTMPDGSINNTGCSSSGNSEDKDK